jgi:hypothetical protein
LRAGKRLRLEQEYGLLKTSKWSISVKHETRGAKEKGREQQ